MSAVSTPSTLGTIRLDALCVARGGREVVHDITVSLDAAAGACLIGPNGSGKTTLLLALLGVLPPARGAVLYDECDIRRLSARQRGRLAAYVPQLVQQLPEQTVGDVVSGGRYPHVRALAPLSPADRAAIDHALEQTGLQALRERPIRTLSGGERQKALLAAALAQDARVLFLDEPDTALDPAYLLELVALLRSWRARGRGLVLVSHDLQIPAALGGRVVALRDGRVAADGDAQDVLTPERLAQVYSAGFERVTTPTGRALTVPAWWRGAETARE